MSKKTSKKSVKAVKAVIAPAVVPTPAVKVEVKAAKTEIIIKDLDISKDITVKTMKTCTSFVNPKGAKWYLKGHTLECTSIPAKLANRIEVLDKKVIEKCHLGYVVGLIKDVKDTADLSAILKSFTTSEGLAKKAKIEKAPKIANVTEIITAPAVEPEVIEEVAPVQELELVNA